MHQSICLLIKATGRRTVLAAAGFGLAIACFASAPAAAQTHNAMPRAERHESRHEIYRLEDLWRVAILKSDTTAMNSLLAEDYMAITPFGTLQNKQQALANLGSGRWHFDSLNQVERKVRFYGTTALVTSLVQVQGTGPQGDISGDYRYTLVYARDPMGKWMIVNFEANRISPHDEPK